MCPCTKQYEPQMPTLNCCMSRTDHMMCLVFLWICRGELKTELDFLLPQRAHFLAQFVVLFVRLFNFWQWSQFSLNSLFQSAFLPLVSFCSVFSPCFSKNKLKQKTHTYAKYHLCMMAKSFSAFSHSCFLQINVCLISWKYNTITKFPVSISHMTTGRQMLRIHLIQASGYTDSFSCNSWRKKCFLAI